MGTSCKKGWLDATSDSQIRAEEQFKAESGFRDALMGVYIGMTDPALYSKDMTWHLVDLLSQQYAMFDQVTANYADIQLYKYKSLLARPKIDALWNNSYKVIANVNAALEGIDKNRSALNPISYSIIKGELLGLRAFLHFDLLRLYGHGNLANRPELGGRATIPYVTRFAKDITPQLSYNETFELLKADIAQALELLKEDPVYKAAGRPSNYYDVINREGFYDKREQRMNYYAAKALQARVLLWQGGAKNISDARLAAEEVINSSFGRLINPATSPASDRILSVEHLFNLDVTAFEDIINPLLNISDVANKNAILIQRSAAEALYETQTPGIGLSDKRFNTLLEAQTRGMMIVKLYQQPNGIRNIMPLMKLPEMYYIAAEHYITTDLAKAIEYLNTVRASRGIIQEIPANSDAATVTAELMKEYRKEYISEGQLFFYYKRLGKTTFPGLPSGVVADDAIYLLPYPDAEIEFGNRVQ